MKERIARITGLGSYLPTSVLTNKDLEKMVETSDEWIVTRTGISERRIASEQEFTSTMAIEAAKKAMDQAGILGEEIDAILVATLTPDYIFPSTAAIVQNAVGAKNAAAFDLQAACTGFLYGLSIAKSFIVSGLFRNVLLIASEKLSSIVDFEDRNTCVLFGDGAAACVVSSEGKGLRIGENCLGADGSLAELLIQPAGGCRLPACHDSIDQRKHFIHMEGKEVFKHAVRRMENAAKICLEKAGLSEDAIDWLVPHQANKRIIDAIAKRFDLPEERVFVTVHKYGNTSASAVAIALDELVREKEVKQGENILLVGFGAGFTWGGTLLTKE